MESKNVFHSVTLDRAKCKGCVACMKRCPTEAIRVRNGKAKIHYEKCIGCGECIRMCTHRAKRAVYDGIEIIENYKYKIALPAPSLFGQFNNLTNMGYIIKGLKSLGFDEVFEVAVGAELASDATRKLVDTGTLKKPVISTACPAIVQLIMMKYHSLAGNLLNLLAPVDICAKIAREKAVEKTGLKPEEIGIFFISPCPAKVDALKAGLTLKKPVVDGVLAVSDIYMKLLAVMKPEEECDEESQTGIIGFSWAASGGEATAVLKEKFVAADGIENCINILKELEDNRLTNVDFIEMNACVSGCVGGVMNIENPFVARSKIRELRKFLPVSKNDLAKFGKDLDYVKWETVPEKSDVMQLDPDFGVALQKLGKIDSIVKELPHLDCGNCGAPSCRAFAEDVVMGEVELETCNRTKY